LSHLASASAISSRDEDPVRCWDDIGISATQTEHPVCVVGSVREALSCDYVFPSEPHCMGTLSLNGHFAPTPMSD